MVSNLPETLNCISLTCISHITPLPPKKELHYMIMHRILKQQVHKSNTFSHVVIHSEFEVFTAADHSYRVPLIVVELLSGIKNLRALA